MGHHLRVIVGEPARLRAILQTYPRATLVALDQGLAMVPVTQGLADHLQTAAGAPPHVWSDDWLYYGDGMRAALRALSTAGPVAYLETEYGGGPGSQSAVAWVDGRCVFERRNVFRGAVHDALEHLGVDQGSHVDRFEAVGLHRHRDFWDLEEDLDER